jgi:hypothetical protein
MQSLENDFTLAPLAPLVMFTLMSILHLINKGVKLEKKLVKRSMYCILIGNEDRMKPKLQQFFFFS